MTRSVAIPEVRRDLNVSHKQLDFRDRVTIHNNPQMIDEDLAAEVTKFRPAVPGAKPCNRTTIWRERTRFKNKYGKVELYDAIKAQRRADQEKAKRGRKLYLENHPYVAREVIMLLLKRRSANKIAKAFRTEAKYAQMDHPCHKSINDFLERETDRGSLLYNWLHFRQKQKKRKVSREKQAQGQQGAPSVGGKPLRAKDRPKYVKDRSRFGDMEADTMIGAGDQVWPW